MYSIFILLLTSNSDLTINQPKPMIFMYFRHEPIKKFYVTLRCYDRHLWEYKWQISQEGQISFKKLQNKEKRNFDSLTLYFFWWIREA